PRATVELDASPRLASCQLHRRARKHALDEEAARSSVEKPIHRGLHRGGPRGWEKTTSQMQRAEQWPLDAPRPRAFNALWQPVLEALEQQVEIDIANESGAEFVGRER